MIDFALAEPPTTRLMQTFLRGCDFHDAYEIALDDPTETPSKMFARAIRATPRWVEAALALRDRLVSVAGIRRVGAMGGGRRLPEGEPKIGDRFGIFTVMGASADELLLGIDDVHLDVRVSIAKFVTDGRARMVITTAVRNHNWLGRIYMIPVARIHPMVVKAMLRRL